MFLQCTRCLHTFESPASAGLCPRCGAPVGTGPAPGAGAPAGTPKTVAMDASMFAQAIGGSSAQNPFGSVAPQQPMGGPPSQPNPFGAPPQAFGAPTPQQSPYGGPPQSFGPPMAQGPYGAQPQAFGAPQQQAPYGAPAPGQFQAYQPMQQGPMQQGPMQPLQPGNSAKDLAGHAIVSVVISAVAFLGCCNIVGLAGVVLGVMAYNDANGGLAAQAAPRARTARILSIVAIVLTALAWSGFAAWSIF